MPDNGAVTPRRRPTQADVARAAGVSVSIVSAVINNRQYGNIRISEATRERVRRAIQDMGYAPNLAARGLARGTNDLIGIFTFERLFPLQREDFFYEFLMGVEEQADEQGFNLLLLTAAKDREGRRSLFPSGTNGMQLADGGVLLGGIERQDEVRRLYESGFPFVYVGQREIPGVDLSYVGADYFGATVELTRELLRRGHRIMLVDEVHRVEPVPGRLAGFRAVIPDGERLEALVEAYPEDDELEAFIVDARDRGVDVLMVEHGNHAHRFADAAARIPDAPIVVSLGGAPDDEGTGDLGGIVIPRREMGREAVRLLARLIKDPASGPQRTILQCEVRFP